MKDLKMIEETEIDKTCTFTDALYRSHLLAEYLVPRSMFVSDIKNLLHQQAQLTREDTIKEAISIIRTHPEGEGSWCDTGEDMGWDCRSDCVESALYRLGKLLNPKDNA